MTLKKKRAAKRIRTGDTVIAIAGNDRGKSGTVLRRIGEDKVLVQGLNVRKKSVRRSEATPQGGMVDREMPIHLSNLMLSPDGTSGVKLRVKNDKKGQRELFYLQDGKEHSYRQVKKAK